ncbi:hypothetical protein DM860_015644 [Cuscuta australis]|uniref:Uncharacterized protein n=1 Tax=Cuscuta australis TaxID=267555 RepID=A0A328DFJ2_9ASTE|nr:hypothetical protein DM860_015644 [Cuscuta australis]
MTSSTPPPAVPLQPHAIKSPCRRCPSPSKAPATAVPSPSKAPAAAAPSPSKAPRRCCLLTRSRSAEPEAAQRRVARLASTAPICLAILRQREARVGTYQETERVGGAAGPRGQLRRGSRFNLGSICNPFS